MEKPVQAEEPCRRKNPYARQSRDAERNKSSEAGGLAVKKSRYCSSCTRTAELDITIDNLGFAPAYRRFTTELILTNRESGDSVTVPVDFDNRRLSAGCSSVLSISIDVRNLEKGDYNLALSMTDETLELPVTFANKNSSSTVFLGTLTR